MSWTTYSAGSASASSNRIKNKQTRPGSRAETLLRADRQGLRGHVFAGLIILGLLLTICGPSPADTASQPSSRPAKTGGTSILATIPADAAAAYVSFGQGGIDAGTGQVITSLLSTASLAGLFNANQQIAVDIVSSAVAIGKYPNAVSLLDIRAKKLGEGSFTLDGMNLGVVVQAPPEDHGKLLAILKQTIDHYFTQDDATLSWAGEGPSRRQRLESKRFPQWCVWEWGSVGGNFVFAVGPGTFDRIFNAINRADKSLADNTLMRLAGKYDKEMDKRFLMVYLNPLELGKNLRPTMESTFDSILASFAADDMDQFLYSAGFAKRAYISKTYTQRKGKVEVGELTSDFAPGDPRARAVPPQATSYGIGFTDLSRAIHYGVNTYLASRNPVYRNKLKTNYNKLEDQAGAGELHAFIRAHFGPAAMVIVHDWPRHPFNLPIGKTLLIQHDASPSFKPGADKIFATWSGMLRAMAGKDTSTKPGSAWETLFDLQLDRSPDGVWYLHLGPVILVAFGLDDNFLVISYSVPAVQANLQHLQATFHPTTTRSATSSPG